LFKGSGAALILCRSHGEHELGTVLATRVTHAQWSRANRRDHLPFLCCSGDAERLYADAQFIVLELERCQKVILRREKVYQQLTER